MNVLTRFAGLSGLSLLLASCSSLTIENVQYGWPIESVLTVTQQNMVTDGYHALTFTVAPIAAEEFQDSTALRGKEIRLLRSAEGYYFLTGKGFRNVYVYLPAANELQYQTRIEVSPTGLKNPAMNQRPPFVELLDGSAAPKRLTHTEVVQEEKP